MAVNNKYITFIISSILLSSTIYAKENSSQEDILIYTNSKMKDALIKFGERIQVCKKKEANNPIMLNVNEIKNLNITSADFNIAIVSLNYKNYDQCVRTEAREYIYNALLSYHTKAIYNNEDKSMLDPMLMSLPTKEILQALSKYDTLSIRVKEYFEKTIGTEPFDIVKISVPILESMRRVNSK